MGEEITLDVREMPPWERHPKIFELFDSIKPGDTIKLINDHNPAPLHYQFMHERKDQFEWKTEEISEREWVAYIRKIR